MEPFLGQLALFPYTFAPRSWADCDGQLLPISSNSALFSLIGTIYGGDGRTTFALPDLRGRVPIHLGTGPGLPTYSIGQRAGNYQTFLTVNNLPAHNHTATASVSATNAASSTPVAGESIGIPGSQSGRAFNPTLGYVNASPNVNLNSGTITVNNTGSNTAIDNMQPYLTMRWCIALQGIYPSRS